MQVFQSLSDPRAARILKEGAVGVIPTDTVYGLVCCASSKSAVERLFNLKKREHKPGTILAASLQQLVELGIRTRYLKAVEYFWPNPISVVIPCGDDLVYLHQGKHSLAVRIPADADLCDLLKQTGPLMTTSANHPTEPTAHTMNQAQKYFGDSIDFYVDGGDLSGRPPSTIIRVVDDAIEVIRHGAVDIDESGRIQHG